MSPIVLCQLLFHYLISSVVHIIILRNGIRSNIKFFCYKPFNIFSIKRDSSILKIEFKQNEYMFIKFNDLRKRPRKINVVTFEKKNHNKTTTKKNPRSSLTFITHISCPSSITSFVTPTSHVITDGIVFTVSFTPLNTTNTVQPQCTFWLKIKAFQY